MTVEITKVIAITTWKNVNHPLKGSKKGWHKGFVVLPCWFTFLKYTSMPSGFRLYSTLTDSETVTPYKVLLLRELLRSWDPWIVRLNFSLRFGQRSAFKSQIWMKTWMQIMMMMIVRNQDSILTAPPSSMSIATRTIISSKTKIILGIFDILLCFLDAEQQPLPITTLALVILLSSEF